MALPSSGEITIDDIRTELGETTGSLRSLSATAGFSSPDAMSEFYGYSAGPTPTDNFDIITYQGNGQQPAGPVLNFGFEADMIIVKGRNIAKSARIHDIIRGGAATLDTTTGTDETVVSTGLRVDFRESSTSSRIETASAGWNSSGYNYVAYGFKGGGTGTSNTSGSITSTVSANQAAGFSIVTYTGNGTSGATFGHGLSSAPELVIVKGRNTQYAFPNWNVYSNQLNGGSSPQNYFLYLNTTDAEAASSSRWNNTAPTSSVITLGNSVNVNELNGTYVAYCFHSVSGYSKIGSYTGGGSTDVSVTTGFRPRFILVRSTDNTDYWTWFDAERSTSASDFDNFLYFNSAEVEVPNIDAITTTSTGFTVTRNNARPNFSGYNYMYLAIA